MSHWLRRLVRRILLILIVALVGFMAARIYQTESGPPLQPWHLFVPKEMSPVDMERADFAAYLDREKMIFDSVRREVTEKLEPADRVASNRYFGDSPINPDRFKMDWNRSFELLPDGEPKGAVVLLHGLTDAPYSLRHIAEDYRQHGFAAVGIRLPGHGTVPGGLTVQGRSDWEAATRLAVREARRVAGEGKPIHLVGYSNGGALALMYALDAIEDPSLAWPDRIVLMSPMVGVTRFARFAGLAGLPALLPAFSKAAWLGIQPEYNPFKYNSFPVNAARQSFLLSDALQQRLARLAGEGKLANLAPVLTFQSVLDHTVSTRAIVTALYDQLPANGSELVLFDINRASMVGPLFRPSTTATLESVLSPPPRRYRVTVLADSSPRSFDVVERTVDAGGDVERIAATGLTYPADVYSLSHIAVPFPVTDGLYGTAPDPADDFGVQLGAMAVRGERGALVVGADTLMRMSSNPFFPYMIRRIDEGFAPVAAPAQSAAPTDGAASTASPPATPPAAPMPPDAEGDDAGDPP